MAAEHQNELEQEQMIISAFFEDEDSNDSSSASSSSSSSSSDDDDEYLNSLNGLDHEKSVRNCIKGYVEVTVPNYSDREFITHFRVSRSLFQSLVDKFEVSPGFVNLIVKESSITPERHILAFLWFAGHQTASFRDVADRFDMAISSLHDVITRVTHFLSNLSADVIKWPSEAAKAETDAHYRRTKGFPNIIGHIDGSHIRIDKPSESADEYVNRKGFHSIILQGVCDHRKKFIDIFIGFTGSVHDARVFKVSELYDNLNNYCKDGYMLGDSAYPCLNSLLTPYKDNGHLTAAQKNSMFGSVHVV